MGFFAGISVVAIILIVFIIGLAFGGLGAEDKNDLTKENDMDIDNIDRLIKKIKCAMFIFNIVGALIVLFNMVLVAFLMGWL